MSASKQKPTAVSASTNASGTKAPNVSVAEKILFHVRHAIAKIKENNPFIFINIEDDDSHMVDVGRAVSPKVSLPSKGSLSAKGSLSFLVKGIDVTFSAVDKALEFLPNSFTTKLASGGELFVTPISPVMRLRLIDYFEKLKYTHGSAEPAWLHHLQCRERGVFPCKSLDCGSAGAYEGPAQGVRVEAALTVADGDMVDIALGKLNPQAAFMKGKLKIAGNIMLTQKLAPLLKTDAKL
ncbi:hypothetical protein ACLKA6_017638 [Drosophila palustris]